MLPHTHPPIPSSWSALTWQQLCRMWAVKQRYGGNADVARAAALLCLVNGEGFKVKGYGIDERTGEQRYLITNHAPLTLNHEPCEAYIVTPRDLSHMARQALPWFDFPYGDPGEREQRDEHGKVTRERREPVSGYVNPNWRDAMVLPSEYVVVQGSWLRVHGSKIQDVQAFKRQRWWKRLLLRGRLGGGYFMLPAVAMNNLTWHQYRSLQAIAPQLWQDGNTAEQTIGLQAQFLAHCLVPRSLALLDSSGNAIKLRPHYVYEYDAGRAARLVSFFKRKLTVKGSRFTIKGWLHHKDNYAPLTMNHEPNNVQTLFYILYQVYQTSLSYYASAYPILFNSDGKQDQIRDALQGEVGTINTIMKYAGYSDQQQVYDSNLPFVLDILNTMTKEAKEIEQMNRKIKRNK